MTRVPFRPLVCLAVAAAAAVVWAAPARADVRDNAHIFSAGAVSDANATLAKLEQQFHKQLVVETIPSVGSDQQAALQQQGKEAFFDHLKGERANALKVNGVYVLICMDPPFIDDAAGRQTIERGIFTNANLSDLRQQFRSALHDKQFDRGLGDAVETVRRAYTTNIPSAAGPSGRTPAAAPYARPSAGSGTNAPPSNYPAPTPKPSSGGHVLSIGSLICVGVALLIVFSLVRKLFSNRSGRGPGGFGGGGGGNYGGGGNVGGGGFGGGAQNYPTGGPSYGPGYGGPPQQQGGSGFGKGFLGGLLGGAVGGVAADRFEHRNDPAAGQGGGGFFGGGGGSDTSGGAASGGGSFDSGPSDAGQGFADSGGGADFGGGGDSGGGGGDSGGGGGDAGSF